jgi:hypothetical protein
MLVCPRQEANELITTMMLAESLLEGHEAFGGSDEGELRRAREAIMFAKQAIEALGFRLQRVGTARPQLQELGNG